MDPIYLDHNAATSTHPEVAEAISRCYAEVFANPASQHHPGQQARRVLEDSRERIAQILDVDLAPPRRDRLIFTSGGTEANNLAILGIARALGRAGDPAGEDAASAPPGQIIISSGEHQSVIEPAEHLLEQGWRVDTLGLTPQGVVRVEQLSTLLSQRAACGSPCLVSVQLGNHETGVLQPIGQLAAICGRAGVPLHTDAVQAIGKLPVSFRGLGVAAMSITAHKFRGPLGIGALVVRDGVPLQPLMFGGHQQAGLRPGTESAALAVGMATALDIWQQRQEHAPGDCGAPRSVRGRPAPACPTSLFTHQAGRHSCLPRRLACRPHQGRQCPPYPPMQCPPYPPIEASPNQQHRLSRPRRPGALDRDRSCGRGLFGRFRLFQRFDGAFADAPGDGPVKRTGGFFPAFQLRRHQHRGRSRRGRAAADRTRLPGIGGENGERFLMSGINRQGQGEGPQGVTRCNMPRSGCQTQSRSIPGPLLYVAKADDDVVRDVILIGVGRIDRHVIIQARVDIGICEGRENSAVAICWPISVSAGVMIFPIAPAAVPTAESVPSDAAGEEACSAYPNKECGGSWRRQDGGSLEIVLIVVRVLVRRGHGALLIVDRVAAVRSGHHVALWNVAGT